MKKINTDIKKNVVNYILNILNLKFGILQNYLANRVYDNNKLFDNFNATQKNSIDFEKKENNSIESIPAKNFANIELIKCYKVVFKIKSLVKNYGYLLLLIT